MGEGKLELVESREGSVQGRGREELGGIRREGGLRPGAAWQSEAEAKAAGNWPHRELGLADHSLE